MTTQATSTRVAIRPRVPRLTDLASGLDREVVEAIPLATAREIRADLRAAEGFKRAPTPLLTQPDGNAKFAKGSGVPVFGLALAPDRSSRIAAACPWSTAGCRAHCVAHAGKGGLDDVRAGCRARTAMLAAHPGAFVRLLDHEIRRAAARHGQIAVRLNTFSDLPWETIAPWLFEIRGVTFYDYTKAPERSRPTAALPASYHLTRSASERHDWRDIAAMVDRGERVAVVVDIPKNAPAPAVVVIDGAAVPVVDGDENDRRDHPAAIVLLRPKGSLRADRGSRFVKQLPA